MTNELKALRALIDDSRTVLITTHERPDGDAVGALLGLSYILEALGKSWVAFSDDAPPEYFHYLDLRRITTDPSILRAGQFDLVILLDIGDVKRTRATAALLANPDRPRTAVLDHHATTLEFNGTLVIDLAIVYPKVSSTSEILYEFCRENDIVMSRNLATCLLTGILTDTGGFSNMATTTRSMEIASRLLMHGALIQEVNDNTWKNKSLKGLQLWGRALSRLKRNPKTGIVSTAIFQKDLSECQTTNDSIEGIANFLNSLEDATAALLLKEMPDGLVNGSYRTTAPNVDVARLAGQYGGGGHVRAAGFTTPGRIIETEVGWEIATT